MKPTIKFTLLVLISFIFLANSYSQSASSHVSKAKKYYAKGDYANSSFEAMKALKINPKKKKAQELLSLSFENAQEDLLEEIEDLKSSSSIYQGDQTVKDREHIVKAYLTLKKLDRKLKDVFRTVKSKKFDLDFDNIDVKADLLEARNLLTEAKEESAENHYLSGLSLMKLEDRENSKKAAKEFKIAQSFVPNYKQSVSLYEEARKNGTTRIAIFAFDNKSEPQTLVQLANRYPINFLLHCSIPKRRWSLLKLFQEMSWQKL